VPDEQDKAESVDADRIDPALDAELVPREDVSPEEAAMHLESDDAAMP
jgi:hypothetical protein